MRVGACVCTGVCMCMCVCVCIYMYVSTGGVWRAGFQMMKPHIHEKDPRIQSRCVRSPANCLLPNVIFIVVLRILNMYINGQPGINKYTTVY